MKTTVDIPDRLMKDALRISKASTKREAVVHAMTELVRQEKKKEILALLGTRDTFMDQEELMDMRLERGKYAPKKK